MNACTPRSIEQAWVSPAVHSPSDAVGTSRSGAASSRGMIPSSLMFGGCPDSEGLEQPKVATTAPTHQAIQGHLRINRQLTMQLHSEQHGGMVFDRMSATCEHGAPTRK